MKKYNVMIDYEAGMDDDGEEDFLDDDEHDTVICKETVVLAEDEESAIEMAIDEWDRDNYIIPPGGGWCGMYKYITAKEIIEAI